MEQIEFVYGMDGCDMIQGYYFAKSMPKEEYALRMEKNE